MVPCQKKQEDQTLEVDARFQMVSGKIWLLDEVRSVFRGGAGGSTGRVEVVEQQGDLFGPVQEVLERLEGTSQVLDLVGAGPRGGATGELKLNEWTPLVLSADWSEPAAQSARAQSEGKRAVDSPLIGVHHARLSRETNGTLRLELAGVTTTYLQEFQTDWSATVLDRANRELARGTNSVDLKCDRAPGAFTNRLELPPVAALESGDSVRVRVAGKVRRLTGAYHGHGMWFRLAR